MDGQHGNVEGGVMAGGMVLRRRMISFLMDRGMTGPALESRNRDLMRMVAGHFNVKLEKNRAVVDQIDQLLKTGKMGHKNNPAPKVNEPYDRAKKRVEAEKKSFCPGPAFYQTDEWRALRYQALRRYGGSCQCCGRKPPLIVLHVDHIKPRSKYPELELDINNLQVLCEDCNLGKSNKDETDWRPDTITRRRRTLVRELMQARYAVDQEPSEQNYAWVKDVLEHLKKLDSHSESPGQTGIGEIAPVGQRTLN